MRIRVGGSLQDQVVYNVGYANADCPQFTRTTDGLFGFSKGCLPQKRWDELNDLFNQTGYIHIHIHVLSQFLVTQVTNH